MEGGKLEMEVGKVLKRGKRGEDLFFFFFSLFTFENNGICFGSTKMGIF